MSDVNFSSEQQQKLIQSTLAWIKGVCKTKDMAYQLTQPFSNSMDVVRVLVQFKADNDALQSALLLPVAMIYPRSRPSIYYQFNEQVNETLMLLTPPKGMHVQHTLEDHLAFWEVIASNSNALMILLANKLRVCPKRTDPNREAFANQDALFMRVNKPYAYRYANTQKLYDYLDYKLHQ